MFYFSRHLQKHSDKLTSDKPTAEIPGEDGEQWLHFSRCVLEISCLVDPCIKQLFKEGVGLSFGFGLEVVFCFVFFLMVYREMLTREEGGKSDTEELEKHHKSLFLCRTGALWVRCLQQNNC